MYVRNKRESIATFGVEEEYIDMEILVPINKEIKISVTTFLRKK